jgi:uncharacterized heparinase superfamily protein
MTGIGRYWHTLRHLKPVQLYGRLRFRLVHPRVDLRPAPALRAQGPHDWVGPAPHAVSLVGPESLRFLNETHSLADHGWDDPALEKLWLYNLHYFDDLGAPAEAERRSWQRALLVRWVRENPPAAGTGWEPYPTSLRIVNWVKWALAGNALPAACVQSLAVQTRWLAGRLERHLLGNHLFANAKALVFAGLFFEGAEARGWLEHGLAILAREIPEQILDDGGQFERSPMYHALALEDVLDLCNAAATFADAVPARWRPTTEAWRPRACAMHHWLATMCHPDGEIAFFNDAAFGVAPSPRALAGYVERLGIGPRSAPPSGVTSLANSGYVRVACDEAAALLDVAPVGPDYLPGHAHADTLSFELSLFGQRVLVNSGTSRYGDGIERLRQRGTAAHNTVVVDGEDSSEVWGGFRVARRARPVGLTVECGTSVVVRCAHDGYRRLPGRPEHERRWTFGDRRLIVEDRVSGRFGRAEARFHLHPGVVVGAIASRGDGSSTVTLTLPEGQRVGLAAERGHLAVTPATWHPEFGRTEPNACLVVRLDGAVARVRLDWSGAA